MSSDGSPATLIGTAFIIAIFNVMTPAVSTAQPQTVIVPIPLLPVPVNPCTGEPIVVNGESRFVTYGHSDSGGGFHALVRIIAKGKGETIVAPAVAPGAITPAGAKYVMNTEYVEEAYLAPPGVFREFTVITNQVWVRQGEDPNAVLPTATDDDFRVKVTIHMTWNADGVPTAEVSQERATCPTAPEP